MTRDDAPVNDKDGSQATYSSVFSSQRIASFFLLPILLLALLLSSLDLGANTVPISVQII